MDVSACFGSDPDDDEEEEQGGEGKNPDEKSIFDLNHIEMTKDSDIQEDVWAITAAHVLFSKLQMRDDNDITSNIGLNADFNICAIYTPANDIAMFRLPSVKKFAPIKLHVAESRQVCLSDWSPQSLSSVDPTNIVVAKIGAKTGITFGTYAGFDQTVTDTDASVEYAGCVRIKHAENNCGRFCKPGDSGSVYFALLPTEPVSRSPMLMIIVSWIGCQ